MKKYTQKQLKELINNNIAIDITNGTNETRNDILKLEGNYTTVGYSAGIHGINGLLIQGTKSKQLYAITNRSTSIFVFY